MNDTTNFKTIPDDTPMYDDLQIVRDAVAAVAAENQALRASERASERISAAQAFRMQLKEGLGRYGLNIDDVPQHIIDDNSVTLMEVARGTLVGIGLQGVAERLRAQVEAYNEAKEEQLAKEYTVSVAVRKDGTVSSPWIDANKAQWVLASERALDLAGYRSVTHKGFTSDNDAAELLLNPVACEKMFGAKLGLNLSELPTVKETADELGLSYFAPQTTDSVVMVIFDGPKVTKKSKVIGSIAVPLLKVPQVQLRDFGHLNLTENACVSYLAGSVPNAELAKEIAHHINMVGIAPDMKFVSDLADVVEG